jgi:hypothetical protein
MAIIATSEGTYATPKRKAGHGRAVALVGAGFRLGVDRVPAGRGRRRAAARPDEDAVTLAVEAAAEALDGFQGTVGRICLATITPPYLEGGSVQALAEILGLQGAVQALELTSSSRDGLAALRLAAGGDGDEATLVCAAHVDPSNGGDGAGAVALLLKDGEADLGGAAMAILTPAASIAVEIRDRWRLPGDARPRLADKSFVQEIGTEKLLGELAAEVPDSLAAPAIAIGPDPRGSAAVERAMGGPGDPLSAHIGQLGSAQPLLRALSSLDSEALVLAISNGLGEALHLSPMGDGAALAARLRGEAESGGHEAERPIGAPDVPDFDPYSSGPRSWRDRGSDLRLEGLLPESSSPAGLRPPTGTVIAWTGDRVYPAAALTEMIAVEIDGGGRFFGQVAMGEHVQIGDRVQLVPRRLHTGGGVIQYFWKGRPCR